MRCLFATDLHGRPDRYDKLLAAIEERVPDALFVGGDLTPFPLAKVDPDHLLPPDFVRDYLIVRFDELRLRMKDRYPRVFAILGNDDLRAIEPDMEAGQERGVWEYIHERHARLGAFDVYGYACVPPTPFLLKDWERYDVSRYVPPGSVSPETGRRSVEIDEHEIRYGTIQRDLDTLFGDSSLANAVVLFHTPPNDTMLDRIGNDGKKVEHVPLDLHVGSFAVRRAIEKRQPLVTLHGHIHESARLTGAWRDRIGRTEMLGAAHDGPELALVRFDLERPEDASRALL